MASLSLADRGGPTTALSDRTFILHRAVDLLHDLRAPRAPPISSLARLLFTMVWSQIRPRAASVRESSWSSCVRSTGSRSITEPSLLPVPRIVSRLKLNSPTAERSRSLRREWLTRRARSRDCEKCAASPGSLILRSRDGSAADQWLAYMQLGESRMVRQLSRPDRICDGSPRANR